MKDKNKKTKMFLLIFPIFLLVFYNVAVFSITGWNEHNEVFWISVSFVWVAFVLIEIFFLVFHKNLSQRYSWILGLPIGKYSLIYLVVELIVSSLFIAFEENVLFGVALISQGVLFLIYLAVVSSIFFTKEEVEKVRKRITDDTQFIKTVQIQLNQIVKFGSNMKVQELYSNLYELIKYSDPVSIEESKEIEMEILGLLERTKSLESNDLISLSERLRYLIEQRNNICKIYKNF